MTSKKSRSGTGSGSDLERDRDLTATDTRVLVPDRDRDHETLILPDLETETRSGTALPKTDGLWEFIINKVDEMLMHFTQSASLLLVANVYFLESYGV